jgi:branched-chain amino acid transport system permease protein
VLQEGANKLDWLTGGTDGLGGITMGPVFGLWEFDFIGQTGYIYAVCVLFVVTIVLKTLTNSPFGLSLRGIKDSPARMRAIGTSVGRRKIAVYTIAGAVAGVAGALAAQSTALVSLSVYDFQLSAEAVLMLVLGGTGRLWGALIGTAVFMSVHEVAASVDPFNWLFIIGLLVLAVVYAVPRGLIGLPEELKAIARRLK